MQDIQNWKEVYRRQKISRYEINDSEVNFMFGVSDTLLVSFSKRNSV
jgi:hypothetical protein